MSLGRRTATFAVEHSRRVALGIIGVTAVLAILAVLPSIWPHRFESLHSLHIDTNPENMLPDDEPVRVFHDRMKEIMSLNDMIVVGVVNPKNEEHGVFNPQSLKKIHALTQFARGLRWRQPEHPDRWEGVVEENMIAPSMVDNVESAGPAVVRFEWLMSQPPETQEQALAVQQKALDLPFLRGTLVSEDGKAIAIYLPISTKDVSYRIYNTLQQKLANPSRLFPSDIGNWNDLLHRLAEAEKGEGDPLVRRLWQELSPEVREQVIRAEEQSDRWTHVLSRLGKPGGTGQVPTPLAQEARSLLKQRSSALEFFVTDTNRWMEQPAEEVWLQPEEEIRKRLDAEGRKLLEQKLKAEQAFRLKRLWVEAAFPDTIISSPVAQLKGDESYHITGLPVAEDTFGVQMFKQMAISAPLAMGIIFVLMWLFFRSAVVILPAMYDAMIATVATMSLLVVTGNTIHIMSSMIPIFIIPIAVLDDVHVISEFFDRYQQTRDRKQTLVEVMEGLFTPMLYTTLTTAVGFASLALAPIPPVQVFGLFVAFGVIVAWLCSILLVPAFISALPEKKLRDFGAKHGSENGKNLTTLGRVLGATGRGTYRYAKPILALSLAALVVSVYGISRIRVNDNPTKWFEPEHPIRVADAVLNDHFGGTYMAYLAFRPKGAPVLPRSPKEKENPAPGEQPPTGGSEPGLPQGLSSAPETGGRSLPAGMEGSGDSEGSGPSLPSGLGGRPEAPPKEQTAQEEVPTEKKPPIFKEPAALRWIGALETYMGEALRDRVGKSNSVTDIVETVHRELMAGVERDGRVIGREEAMRVPDTRGGVAQSLLQFQNSHRPDDLWHFVTPDYRTAVIWLQLTSGDNRDMSEVARGVNDWLKFWKADEENAAAMVEKDPERFQPVLRSVAETVIESSEQRREVRQAIAQSPGRAVSLLKQEMESLSPAHELQHDWFGLTYINVVWQEKMVKGMLKALLGSFLAVFLMMTLLYRSAIWGALCMAPLTVTIAMIYGLIGWIGKDYDMPVAVLSALSLGLAVDYAIHFLTRSRMMYPEYGSWQQTSGPVFGEPARAISRNAIVVGIGFLPLVLAPLVPYQTVGMFIAAILLLAGVATMLLLPAAVTLLEERLFPRTQRACTICNRATCIIAIITAVILVAFNLQQFIQVGWTTLTWIGAGVILALGGLCAWTSRRERSVTEIFVSDEDETRRKGGGKGSPSDKE
jgi:hypothetical protein